MTSCSAGYLVTEKPLEYSDYKLRDLQRIPQKIEVIEYFSLSKPALIFFVCSDALLSSRPTVWLDAQMGNAWVAGVHVLTLEARVSARKPGTGTAD